MYMLEKWNLIRYPSTKKSNKHDQFDCWCNSDAIKFIAQTSFWLLNVIDTTRQKVTPS